MSFLLFSDSMAYGQSANPETILSFRSELNVKNDLSVIVTENIRVRIEGRIFRRGIFRDIPKEYIDRRGIPRKLNFEIVVIFRGDAPEEYRLEDLGPGKRIYIGKKDFLLPPGIYNYTIIYKVDTPILITEDAFQLYWDVTGVRWPVPIKKASAIIKLPLGNLERIFEQQIFSGSDVGPNLNGQNIFMTQDRVGNSLFNLKHSLKPGERFTIYLSWFKNPPLPPIPSTVENFERLFSPTPNALALGPQTGPDEFVNIPINRTLNLNFKPRQEIFDIRKQYVHQHPDLIASEYKPYFPVWQLVLDEMPWWGIQGAFCYGAGKGSILGDAETSRYFTNPFLLLGVDDNLPVSQKNKSFAPVYIKLKSLNWNAAEAQAVATYDLAGYLKDLQNTATDIRHMTLTLINYNAKDFGYRYVYASPEESHGTFPTPKSLLFKTACKLEHLFQPGESCEYPNGCMEVVPTQETLDFRLNFSKPVRLYCKLWKDRPKTVKDQADFTFIINFEL